MINVYLYTINCDPKVVDKSSFFPATPTLKQGTVRGEVNMMRPDITIEGDMTGYNYMYIPTFNRYYYIDSVDVVRTNLQVVHCKCDVLMSFKDSIYNLPAVLRRSALMINSYLPDEKQRTYQYTQCNSHNIGSEFSYAQYPILITAG